jgi:hypothetical protein
MAAATGAFAWMTLASATKDSLASHVSSLLARGSRRATAKVRVFTKTTSARALAMKVGSVKTVVVKLSALATHG